MREVAELLPRLLLRLKRAVQRSPLDGRDSGYSGEETTLRWYAVMAEMHRLDEEAERRMRRAEEALNRLDMN